MLEKLDGIKRAAVAGLAMLVMGCSGASGNSVGIKPEYRILEETNIANPESNNKPVIKAVYLGEEIPPWMGNPNLGLEGKQGVCHYGTDSASITASREYNVEHRAMVKMAKQMGAKVVATMDEAITQQGREINPEELQEINNASYDFVKQNVDSLQRVSVWYRSGNPDEGKETALLCLYFDNNLIEGYLKHLERSNNISEETRKLAKENAEVLRNRLKEREVQYDLENQQ